MDFNLAVMLRESARRSPGKPAVILDDRTVSYAELDDLSDHVAARLTAAGVTAGDRVGLQLPNIPEFVISFFGILKAGAVVVPMNVLLKAVTLRPGRQATEAELIAFARHRLAPYKYPRSVEFRDDLPKSATGKILKRELRPPERGRYPAAP